MQLDAQQQAAVDMVTGDASPRLAYLGGMPGSGKTQTVRAIVDVLQKMGRTFLLCAPSGKAAKRLSELAQQPAATVHRLLGLRPGSLDPEPISADCVIVDECSMAGIELLKALVDACFHQGGRVGTLLMVGDPEQLPPVSAGQPFLDMLAHAICPGTRLLKNYRQGEGGVLDAAYAIHDGESPEWCEDFQLLIVEESGDIAAKVWDLVQANPDAQVLSPQRTRSGGCNELNEFIDLRDWIACSGDGANYETSLVRSFRVGTKVIHKKNDYRLIWVDVDGSQGEGVFNGETGVVTYAGAGIGRSGKPARGKDRLEVQLDDGRQVIYRGAAIDHLQLAWCLTVHAAQGSEWDTVIFVCHKAHTYMLSRALLYVAVTRARKSVYVVGTETAVVRAIRNVKDVSRDTNLAHMLDQYREAV